MRQHKYDHNITSLPLLGITYNMQSRGKYNTMLTWRIYNTLEIDDIYNSLQTWVFGIYDMSKTVY